MTTESIAPATKITYTSATGDLEAFHRAFDEAVAAVRARGGESAPLFIGGGGGGGGGGRARRADGARGRQEPTRGDGRRGRGGGPDRLLLPADGGRGRLRARDGPRHPG